MTHPSHFRLQVFNILSADSGPVLDPVDNVDSVLAELLDFVWVVGHQPDTVDANIVEHVCSDFVIAPVGRQVER